MKTTSKEKARIAILSEQLHVIHFVNNLYWARGETVTLEARAEYKRRQDRVCEIRTELAKLHKSFAGATGKKAAHIQLRKPPQSNKCVA
jgi:hypothetical protein